ncbi:hypothetical protein DRE_01198 [Drechslerella stenobrocha 248]|uniref:Major facilitator superfamily (MFS) profile domain-containing protein n=1 Tax=Drechslerella stenobrocha 248 TaxID=1043628 RepID=W7HWB1_9PEZI|nr:hypothetical protein DRE_01198 [Drechslerella stenobrocha 248]
MVGQGSSTLPVPHDDVIPGTETSTLAAPSASPSVIDADEKIGDRGSTTSHSNQLQPVDEVPVDEKNELEKTQTMESMHEYPKAWKLAVISIALCLSVFCMALDNTIIATAIPKITDHFNSLNDVGWYGSAYLLTTCSFQLLFGKIYTFYSVKWVYVTAMLIFEVGSILCAAAPTSTALIIGRAIAGVGSAGIFAGALLIVAQTVPLDKRPTYTGMIGSMYGLASVAGPLLGGVFTDSASLTWRWCFWINLPFGAVTLGFIIFFYTDIRQTKKTTLTWGERIEQFDLHGTAVFLPAIICLLLALQWGGSKYPWGNGRVIALLVLAGVLLAAFVGIQIWKQDKGTVPPRIIKQRSIAASAWFAAMLGAAFFVLVYYIPIWFQAIKSVSATGSGIRNLPMILGLVIMSIVAGGLVTVTGFYNPFIIGSTVLASIGAGLITTWEVDTGHAQWIGYQALFGIGIGMGMQQPLIAVQTVLPSRDIATGTAVIIFSQTLGGALAVSIAQNVFNNQLIKNLGQQVPDLDASIVLTTGATSLKENLPAEFLEGALSAYNLSLTQTYYIAVAFMALSIFGAVAIEWKSVKGKKIEMAGGA